MPLIIFIALLLRSTEQTQVVGTPIWVPVAILVLMLLIFVWGLTRGNVLDENRPQDASAGHGDHDEPVEDKAH